MRIKVVIVPCTVLPPKKLLTLLVCSSIKSDFCPKKGRHFSFFFFSFRSLLVINSIKTLLVETSWKKASSWQLLSFVESRKYYKVWDTMDKIHMNTFDDDDMFILLHA